MQMKLDGCDTSDQGKKRYYVHMDYGVANAKEG